jgi:hypothetical protein
MGSPEACVERVGSLMQASWSKRKNEDAGKLMDGVLLQDAKVTGIGNPRDEMICREVALAFSYLGRRPAVVDRTKRRRLASGRDGSVSLALLRHREQSELEASGRESAGAAVQLQPGLEAGAAVLGRSEAPRNLREAKAERRAGATPAMRPSAAGLGLMQTAASGTFGRVRALPLFVAGRARNEAGSVHRQRLHRWLESDEGKEWQQAKTNRHDGAD